MSEINGYRFQIVPELSLMNHDKNGIKTNKTVDSINFHDDPFPQPMYHDNQYVRRESRPPIQSLIRQFEISRP